MKTACFMFMLLFLAGGCARQERDFYIFKGTLRGGVPTWAPSEEQVQELIRGAKSHLSARIAEEAKASKLKSQLELIISNWDGFVCQAVGIKEADAHYLHLRFFPKRTQGMYDLSKSNPQPIAGGWHNWSIKYRIESKAYCQLQINPDD